MSMIGGVDEAGRGPVLGPMVMAAVAIQASDVATLNKMGVKDSKLLTPKKRNSLFRFIRANFPHVIIKVTPAEIDDALRNPNSSLNKLEATTTTKLIRRLAAKTSIKKVMLDLPDKNKEEYLRLVKKNLKFPNDAIPVDAEYKADLNHVQVAAASILAKVTRDKSLQTVEKKLGVLLGSGYPSDNTTVQCLHDNFSLLKKNNLVRLEWKTTKELLEQRRQTRLSSF